MFSPADSIIIKQVAQANGIVPDALLAVGLKESRGRPMWSVNGQMRPAIRFEGHYFYRYLKGTSLLDTAVVLGLASRKAGAVKNPRSYAARYDLLRRAMDIDQDAAIRSTSWGWGQVMGAHYRKLGFKTPIEMMLAAEADVLGQTELVAGFLKANRLIPHLNALPNRAAATRFAEAYNGPGHKKNKYVPKLIRLFNRIRSGTGDEAGLISVQRQLKSLGYDPGPIDGILGRRTTQAIEKFQIDAGLVADGDPGPMTQEALEAQMAARGAARRRKAAAPVAMGGGALAAGGSQIIAALSQGSVAAESTKGILATVGLSGYGTAAAIVGSIVVLAVTGYVVWRFMQDDDDAKEAPL